MTNFFEENRIDWKWNNSRYLNDVEIVYFYLLKQVLILSSVTSIGECAFRQCSLLAQIIIPSSETGIREGCFYIMWIIGTSHIFITCLCALYWKTCICFMQIISTNRNSFFRSRNRYLCNFRMFIINTNHNSFLCKLVLMKKFSTIVHH